MESMLLPWILAQRSQCSTDIPEIPLLKSKVKSKEKLPHLRLVSLCTRDMAEVSRMILAYAGVKYDNFTMYEYKDRVESEYGKSKTIFFYSVLYWGMLIFRFHLWSHKNKVKTG